MNAMSRLQLIAAATLLAAAAGAQQGTQPGSVKLPLADYLALIGRIEALEKATAEAVAQREPSVAEVTAMRTSIVWGEETAQVTTTLDAEVRGAPVRPVSFRLTGAPAAIEVTPAGTAAVGRGGDRFELVAPAVGRYRVKASSVAPLRTDSRGAHLDLAEGDAPVAETTFDLPADAAWECPGAVVASDDVSGPRRHLRLALQRRTASSMRVWHAAKGTEEEKALARAVVVTIVQLGPDGVRRNDVVLYEVSRGSLPGFTVDLPAGIEVERMATDEGEVQVVPEGRHLVVLRTRRLTGIGHLVVTSTAALTSELALDPIVPDVEVRARYLVWAPNVAAQVRPLPEASWARADLGDLPEAIRDASDGIKLSAAWLASGNPGGTRLAITPLPPAPERETLVTRRETTTLLTKEGTVLHRDRFTLQRAGAALEVTLPTDATLWSAAVDGLPVRQVERGGVTLIPLPPGTHAGATVEVVVVQERSIPPGRSRITLAPPQIAAPVLEQSWRLLLPESDAYRFAGGTLKPAPEESAASGFVEREGTGGVEGGVEGGAVGGVPGGLPEGVEAGPCGVRGTVADDQGHPLPGVSVTLRRVGIAGFRTAITGVQGTYFFTGLPPGRYTTSYELAGFRGTERSRIDLAGSQVAVVDAGLAPAQFKEEVTVTGEAAQIDRSKAETGATFRPNEPAVAVSPRSGRGYLGGAAKAAPADASAQARDEIANLKQGLAGGVRPVPVTIPESGKSLLLAGALPPAAVSVDLDVKARR